MVGRFERFVGNGDFLAANQAYLNGQQVSDRMNQVRDYIEQVRALWLKTDPIRLTKELRSGLEELIIYEPQRSDIKESILEAIEHSISYNQKWADEKIERMRKIDEFKLIKAYTDVYQYPAFFQNVNDVFRGFENKDSRLLVATFIIELLNMELFEFTENYQKYAEDHDIVYRGFSLEQKKFSTLKQVATHDGLARGNREISTPLGLHSASTSKEVSFEFAKEAYEKDIELGKDSYVVIQQITSRSLSEEKLEFYHEHFSESIVSKICVTNITKLSTEQDEKEVLLRGAFMELLDLKETDISGIRGYECRSIMIDANRDHISTRRMKEDNPERENKARQLFHCLVGLEKYELAFHEAYKAGAVDVAKYYAGQYDKRYSSLHHLTDHTPPPPARLSI